MKNIRNELREDLERWLDGAYFKVYSESEIRAEIARRDEIKRNRNHLTDPWH